MLFVCRPNSILPGKTYQKHAVDLSNSSKGDIPRLCDHTPSTLSTPTKWEAERASELMVSGARLGNGGKFFGRERKRGGKSSYSVKNVLKAGRQPILMGLELARGRRKVGAEVVKNVDGETFKRRYQT